MNGSDEGSEAVARRLFVIDTDAGIDDAQAILMAMSSGDIDIVGITCVNGNATVSQVARNVLRVLKVGEKLQVPVYVGCDRPLLGQIRTPDDYHGKDGFGDCPDPSPPDENLIKSEHAVQALLRITREHPGKITLVCLGPLTNVAMAIRMDPGFGARLKDCFVMGGNYLGKGNITTSAEFNFHADPEAAFVALDQLGCPLTLTCWELCEDHSLPWSCYEEISSIQTNKAKLIADCERQNVEIFYKALRAKGVDKNYEFVDQYAMAAAMDPEVVIEKICVYATVEVKGGTTQGQMVVDWRGVLKKSPNITLVLKINTAVVKNILVRALQN